MRGGSPCKACRAQPVTPAGGSPAGFYGNRTNCRVSTRSPTRSRAM